MSAKKLVPHPTRANCVCEPAPGGGFVCWPASNTPDIIWNHIDGPLLTFRNGEMHWLTLWERLRCWLGYDDAYSLERKHRRHLAVPIEPLTSDAHGTEPERGSAVKPNPPTTGEG